MKKFIGYALTALCSAAAGGAGVYIVMKKRYDEVCEDRDYYMNRVRELEKEAPVEDVVETFVDEITKSETSEVVEKKDDIIESAKEFVSDVEKPYVINADEYGATGYRERFFIYFDDCVMVDESYNVLSDPEIDEYVDLDNLYEFNGEYLYIRNEELRTDFKIYGDDRCYERVVVD